MWPRTGLPGAKRRTSIECRIENVLLMLSCEWGSIACEKIACNRMKMPYIEYEDKGLQRNFTRFQYSIFYILYIASNFRIPFYYILLLDIICYWNFASHFL